MVHVLHLLIAHVVLALGELRNEEFLQL